MNQQQQPQQQQSSSNTHNNNNNVQNGAPGNNNQPSRMKLAIDELYFRSRQREIRFHANTNPEMAKMMSLHLSTTIPTLTNKILQENIIFMAKQIAAGCNELQGNMIEMNGPNSAGPIDVHTIKSSVRLLFPDPKLYADVCHYMDAAVGCVEKSTKQ